MPDIICFCYIPANPAQKNLIIFLSRTSNGVHHLHYTSYPKIIEDTNAKITSFIEKKRAREIKKCKENVFAWPRSEPRCSSGGLHVRDRTSTAEISNLIHFSSHERVMYWSEVRGKLGGGA